MLSYNKMLHGEIFRYINDANYVEVFQDSLWGEKLHSKQDLGKSAQAIPKEWM